MKKKILIIFPNEWLSYTPTLLNLVHKLKESFEIQVFTIDDGLYNNQSITQKEFEFIKIGQTLREFIFLTEKISLNFGKIRLRGSKFYQFLKIILLYRKARKFYKKNPDCEVIAIDSMGLFVAQRLFTKCHFLSLEPYKDYLFKQSNWNQIESVIAHSEERYKHLFGESPIKTFIIPNSPPLENNKLNKVHQYYPKLPYRAVFFGNATPRNGLYFCLEAIRRLDYISLVVRGKVSSGDRQKILREYGDLIKSGKLKIDDCYLQQEEIIEYLSKFWLGFCFYDFSYVDEVTRFNFISVPSGKMFNYYAAGVPVIGSDILGLKSVRDFNAGVLLKIPSPEAIVTAIEQILGQHNQYRENCFKAAEHFDFNKSAELFKEYLLQKE